MVAFCWQCNKKIVSHAINIAKQNHVMQFMFYTANCDSKIIVFSNTIIAMKIMSYL